MGGNYSVNSRAVGELLTAAKYVADHSVHRDNMTPDGVDDYSASLAQMQQTASPGSAGSEILPTHFGGELERIRYVLRDIKKTPQWYGGSGWGVQDRNVGQAVLVNSTTPTAIYGTTVPALEVDSGLEIVTAVEVLQNTGAVQTMTIDVLYGASVIYSAPTGWNSSASGVGFLLRAHALCRGTPNLLYSCGEVVGSPNGHQFRSSPRLGAVTTTSQVLQVRVTLGVASSAFRVVHAHTQVWRL